MDNGSFPLLLSIPQTLKNWSIKLSTLFTEFIDFIKLLEWGEWNGNARGYSTMSFTVDTVSIYRYFRILDTVFFYVVAGGTTSGVATAVILFNLPFPADNVANDYAFSASVKDTSNLSGFALVSTDDNETVQVYRYDSGSFGIGSSRVIRCMGFYKRKLT